jgi:preprotein translocase subunit SecG
MNLSALVVMSIIVGVVAIIVGVFLQKKHEEDFENTLQQLSASGNRILYQNKRTGTITYSDGRGHRRSLQVFKGYNSHYRG